MEVWYRKTATSDRVSRIAGMFVIYDPQPTSEVETAIANTSKYGFSQRNTGGNNDPTNFSEYAMGLSHLFGSSILLK